jgi:glycosyltransferase involved in cell wall biosynthesis
MVTVFTPVYNRAYIIHQLYQSLLRQTVYDFEWLIVDDGSTDNIEELVSGWIACTRKFTIRFYRQLNGGKHRAVNRGVCLAKGDAFLIVDSDDYLTDDAISTVAKYWGQIKDNPKFAGIAGLRMHEDMQVIGGKPYFDEYVDATNLDRGKHGLEGDKAEVYKTDVLKAFPFPEFEGEQFVTEAVVWNKIAYCGYEIRWFNKGIMICDYLGDGLTAKGASLFVQNPKGWAEYLRSERIYRAWSDHFYRWQCYQYYEAEHLCMGTDDMMELLGLDAKEMREIESSYLDLIQRIAELCRDKRICIYGYGAWGKRLKRHLDERNIPIEYIIDQQCTDTGGIARYTPEGVLPEVDIVLVALKKGADEVISILKGKLERSRMVKMQEIVGEWW